MKHKLNCLLSTLLLIVMLCGCTTNDNTSDLTVISDDNEMYETTISEIIGTTTEQATDSDANTLDGLLASNYKNEPYCIVNNNQPYFTEEEKLANVSFESYSELDELGRCQVAYACIGTDIMPTEKRGEIGKIKPTGWHTVKYPEIISDLYLYNRCHLIAYCLTGENANEKNLITGTRYLNISGMLPFETEVANYMDNNPNNHVLYRVTPIFKDDNLLAEGVLMEGYSVEDKGEGIQFCVFCYNVQPDIQIDYKTGDSSCLINNDEELSDKKEETSDEIGEYILNTNTMKIHTEGCSAIEKMSNENKQEITASFQSLLNEGYTACGLCKPK